MNKQRIYDAMLIKAFRKDVRMTDLEKWLAPYDIKMTENNLMRVPKYIFWIGRVQEMVGRHLKPLADRLWDTDSSQDIKTLDWMSNLSCANKYTKWDVERTKLIKDSNNARRKGGILAEAGKRFGKNGQWNIVK